MFKKLSFLVASAALGVGTPASPNVVIEPTFAEKMAISELVVIGTVTAVNPGGQRGVGSTATLEIWWTLKGEHRQTISVRTWHEVDELNPRCCEVGATYMMFLKNSARGQLMSVRGVFGMVRIAGPQREWRVLPPED
jgi:hypothetical protein